MRRVRAAIAALALAGGVAATAGLATAHAAPSGWVTNPKTGISCQVGAPYVDGGGYRPGYFFDRNCEAVTSMV